MQANVKLANMAASTVVDNIKEVREHLKGDGNVHSTQNNYEIVLREDNRFKGNIIYNELSEKVEFKNKIGWSTGTSELCDIDISCILSMIQKSYGMYSEKSLIHALQVVANENRVNPMIELIEGITWDGVERICNVLPKYLGSTRTTLVDEIAKLLFISVISRTYEPGCKFDYLFCLTGGQGIGKSTFCRLLALDDKYYTDDVGVLSDKNIYEYIRGYTVVELAEATALVNSKSIENTKAMVSRQMDNYRQPYQRYAMSRPRRCIMISTSNTKDFLPNDVTGNRRFLVIEAGETEFTHVLADEQETREYIRQCYAEALTLYKKGEYSLDLSPEGKEMLKQMQKNFVVEDVRIGAIQDYLDNHRDESVCIKKIFKEVFQRDDGNTITRFESMDIARILDFQIEDWTRCSNKRYGEWGSQKSWEYTGNK